MQKNKSIESSENMKKYQGNGLSGLQNMGNTCYLNTAIQNLMCVDNFVRYFLSNKHEAHIHLTKEELNIIDNGTFMSTFKMLNDNNKLEGVFAAVFIKLIKALWEEDCNILPKTFRIVLLKMRSVFGGSGQQDSHEFLVFLLDLLHRGLSKEVRVTIKDEDKINAITLLAKESWKRFLELDGFSIIIYLFYGQFHSQVQCLKCKNISHTFDPFSYLSLPIPEKSIITLNDCIETYYEKAALEKGNAYDCEKCDMKVEAEKLINIWTYPQFLIIQLKRFTQTDNGMLKNSQLVDFPITNLTFKQDDDNNIIYYDLVAIANHTGGIQGGHYYAYGLRPNGKWYNFNDISIQELNPNQLVTNTFIFYFIKNTCKK